MASNDVPPQFGFVLLTLFLGIFVHHFWMAFKVVGARKKYDPIYPSWSSLQSWQHGDVILLSVRVTNEIVKMVCDGKCAVFVGSNHDLFQVAVAWD
jgi:hypothetical protein